MNFIRSLLVAAFVLIPLTSFAEDDNETKLVLEAGIHVGGDTLYTATFTDGSTETIHTGDGLSLAIGGKFAFNENVDMMITYGVKESSIDAMNGSVTWTRYPLNAIVLYDVGQLNIGGGLTYHMSPTLKGTGIVAGEVKFDNALGTLLEVHAALSERAYVGLRLTFIDYQLQGTSVTFNGNSIGLMIAATI